MTITSGFAVIDWIQRCSDFSVFWDFEPRVLFIRKWNNTNSWHACKCQMCYIQDMALVNIHPDGSNKWDVPCMTVEGKRRAKHMVNLEGKFLHSEAIVLPSEHESKIYRLNLPQQDDIEIFSPSVATLTTSCALLSVAFQWKEKWFPKSQTEIGLLEPNTIFLWSICLLQRILDLLVLASTIWCFLNLVLD